MKYADILAGLRQMGLSSGDKLLVHSSLGAIGKVDGGADTVIDALLEAVGPDGLVVVPTFACEPPFDRKSSATPLGAVSDRLWRRPDAARSLHPTHSVAAIGKGADDLIRGHEKAPTAYGEGTPYYELARKGGKILLLGLDQDRNTTLHAAEAITVPSYLKTVEASYVDDGEPVSISSPAMAGPHRDFIGLDKLFSAAGIMKIGRVGSAVCRLIEAGPMLDIAVEALSTDPAAVLCDNPRCADCLMQREKIRAARLRDGSFTLAAVAGDISSDLNEVLSAMREAGVSAVELTPDEFERYQQHFVGVDLAAIRGEMTVDDARLADELGVSLIVPGGTREDFERAVALGIETSADVLVENDGTSPSAYVELYADMKRAPSLAFNPRKFAAAGAKPFLEVFYRGALRGRTRHFYIDDGTFDGCAALAGHGNGEVKEIISILRCRSYNGVMTIRSHESGVDAFRRAAAAFWNLMDNM